MSTRRQFLAASMGVMACNLLDTSRIHAAMVPLAPRPFGGSLEQRDIFGVWWRELDDFYRHFHTEHSEIAPGGGPYSTLVKHEAPFVKGVFLAIPWSELEPSDGQYDWKLFDNTFARYARGGL